MRFQYWIFNARNIREKIESFARGPYFLIFLTDMCSFCRQECWPRPTVYFFGSCISYLFGDYAKIDGSDWMPGSQKFSRNFYRKVLSNFLRYQMFLRTVMRFTFLEEDFHVIQRILPIAGY